MLVQALAKYADRELALQLDDIAWEKKRVPWLLNISTQGTFLGAVPRMISVDRGKKEVQVPEEIDFPRSPVNRNSGHHPLLAADDIAYVLGAGTWTPARAADQQKARDHHAAFVTMIARAAAETGDPGLQACTRFYANEVEVERAREAFKNAKPGTLMALSVREPLVYSDAVASFWRRHYQAAFAERNAGSDGECLISGKYGPIAPTHDKIKGFSTVGGQASGVALMSFDKEAFCSYGWEKNENSPVSPDRAHAYVLALNHLLRVAKGKRKDIAGIAFIFWVRDKDDFNLWDELDPPQPDTSTAGQEEHPPVEVVEPMLRFDHPVDPSPNDLYLAGFSGNGGRLRVRYWVTETLNQVKANLDQWREQLRVAYPWEIAGPVCLWQLEYVLDREGKPPAHHTLALVRRAIEGKAQPLGYAMLSATLRRLPHPREDPKPDIKGNHPMRLQRLRIPIGLIRLCLNDIQRAKGEPEMKEGLDEDCAIPAYICGRLMAEFENLQRASSNGEVNSYVLDRYFALASTYPAVAFPKIESLAQKHFRKLRRDNRKVAWVIEGQLQALHNKLQPMESGGYPGKLGLEGQGLFVLGYYHQKAWSIAQARNHKQSNESAKEKRTRRASHEHG
jgi:CRISPR-associated protein Csd1